MAIIMGELVSEGWGSKMGCPGLKLGNNVEIIKGFVFSSDNFSDHWQRLDEFEGEEYCRILSEVQLENGSLIDAYVYALK